MLIALGLVYALLYAAWLRKRRRHTSASVAVSGARAAGGPGGAGDTGEEPVGSVVRAEGTYVSTTTAASRHERVAVQGLGNRSRATMVVRRGAPDELVRFERQGEADVVVPKARLVDVRRDRGMAGKFVGASRLLVVRWKADDDAIYETGFLPRYRADLERLESALWWHRSGSSITADDTAEPTDVQSPEGDPRT
jgi:hypothetical protein